MFVSVFLQTHLKYVNRTGNYSEILENAEPISVLDFGYGRQTNVKNYKEICGLKFDCIFIQDGSSEAQNRNSSDFSAIRAYGSPGYNRFRQVWAKNHDRFDTKRDASQIWIAMGLESAISTLDFRTRFEPLNGLFNWTSSLSFKSTIPLRLVEKVELKQEMGFKDMIKEYDELNKRYSFCWMVIQCSVYNKRFDLASEIINLLPEPTHMWGLAASRCMPKVNRSQIVDHGRLDPEKGQNINNQRIDVIKNCRFYFAFENSNCSEYITEKFHNALVGMALPLVNGWPSSYSQILPHSFIHVTQFPHVLLLVHHINYLLKNQSAYFEYFSWRKNMEGLQLR